MSRRKAEQRKPKKQPDAADQTVFATPTELLDEGYSTSPLMFQMPRDSGEPLWVYGVMRLGTSEALACSYVYDPKENRGILVPVPLDQAAELHLAATMPYWNSMDVEEMKNEFVKLFEWQH